MTEPAGSPRPEPGPGDDAVLDRDLDDDEYGELGGES
jgi:hypothetical protein